MPRFAVLQHDHPRGLHWDFFLESGAILRTWALAKPPDTLEPVPAQALFDHRLAYLDYEGPVSGQRGTASRWDAGTAELVHESADELVVRLSGNRLQGVATLTGQAAVVWTFVKTDFADGPDSRST